MHIPSAISLLLRIALAFSFAYPAISALFSEATWIGYIPQFVQTLPIETSIVLHAFGALEILIALWLLSGWRVIYPALAAAGILFAIVVFNWNQMDVLFRDLSLALVAVALAYLSTISEPRTPQSHTQNTQTPQH